MKKNARSWVLAGLGSVGVLLLGACAALLPADRAGLDEAWAQEAEGEPGTSAPPEGGPASGPRMEEDVLVADQAEGPRRLMVYTARFDLLVSNTAESLGVFMKKVEELGGYLQRRENFTVTCRVPAARFPSLLAEIPALGTVVSQSVSALEVTKEHADLSLRIENAGKARERLLALLEKAEKMEDILKIEAEVRRLTEEIERMKGELKLLSERIAFSTLEVTFRSTAPQARPDRRTRSRFEWINRIGIEHALGSF